MTAKQTKSAGLGPKIAIAVLATATLLTACTGGSRSVDFPEPPIRRGSF